MKLSNYSNRPFYKVPDGYFDQLPTRIQENVQQHSMPSWRSIPNLYIKVTFACSVIILLLVIFLPHEVQEENITNTGLHENFTSDELINYLTQTGIGSSELLEIIITEEMDDDILTPITLEEEYKLQEDLLNYSSW